MACPSEGPRVARVLKIFPRYLKAAEPLPGIDPPVTTIGHSEYIRVECGSKCTNMPGIPVDAKDTSAENAGMKENECGSYERGHDDGQTAQWPKI